MKKLWLIAPILIMIIAIIYSFVKLNPPLEIGTLASGKDQKSVVVGIGNNGFRKLKILNVFVNNDEKPLKAKVQVSDNLKGFIITDDYNNEESKKYVFKNIESVPIKAGISLDKKGEIYGVSIIHNKAIHKVHIKYSYLGISFAKTVPFDK